MDLEELFGDIKLQYKYEKDLITRKKCIEYYGMNCQICNANLIFLKLMEILEKILFMYIILNQLVK